MNELQLGRFRLALNECHIMGVLNCTPDSFSDGGLYFEPQKALHHAENMLRQGARILDVGAESTRPDADEIPAAEEIKRLKPVIQELRRLNCVISVDTKKTEVMKAVLDWGVDMINDVRALEDKGALATVSASQAGVCLMHMRGMPKTMQQHTDYDNVVSEVHDYLQQRAQEALRAGIPRERLLLDFGFGFGKTPAQNMALIRAIPELKRFGYPILVGVSRKSTLGYYLGGAAVDERLHASVTLAALSAYLGANVLRVHDVAATRDALKMVHALQSASV